MSEPDEDLRDAFKLMYDDGDDWADEAHFSVALNSLLVPGPSKRPRIYAAPPSHPTSYPSTVPPPPVASSSTYAPFSPLPYLARLRTFRPSTYPSLPAPLSPARATRHGWTTVGRHVVGCACGARFSVDGVADIADAQVRHEVARRLAVGFETRHAATCPWRTRASPESLHAQLRTLLHPPIGSSLGPLADRIQQECPVGAIRWTSPLTAAQLDNLVASLARHVPASADKENPTCRLAEPAAVLALFGWYPYHPNQLPAHCLVPVSQGATELLSCRLCERRVGLWAFLRSQDSTAGTADTADTADTAEAAEQATRTLDVVQEHLEWCPLRDAWWSGLALVCGQQDGAGGHVDVAVDVKRALTVSERPAKRWRRA
ncbi:hypothetical protein Q5752_002935 [Cryptotrichosporon argae]